MKKISLNNRVRQLFQCGVRVLVPLPVGGCMWLRCMAWLLAQKPPNNAESYRYMSETSGRLIAKARCRLAVGIPLCL